MKQEKCRMKKLQSKQLGLFLHSSCFILRLPKPLIPSSRQSRPSLPDAGVSFIRVIGALALVIGLFLGGVWFFKNWQRLAVQRGRAPKLNILETRSLGGRQAIFVVGYNQERFLISSSPTGVNLLSHLPTVTEGEPDCDRKKFSRALVRAGVDASSQRQMNTRTKILQGAEVTMALTLLH
jgi:flagellar biogenesis protein FliO